MTESVRGPLELADRLQQRFSDEGLPIGARIPVGRAIRGQYGVNGSVLEAALDILTERGVIERPGQGSNPPTIARPGQGRSAIGPERVADRIQRDLETGALASEGRLVAAAIAAQYRVPWLMVRQALRIAEERGIVARDRTGRAVVVGHYRGRAFERVAAVVRERIQTGAFRPGQRLPVAELADEFGVSQASVRDAIALLARRGLVDRPGHGRGYAPSASGPQGVYVTIADPGRSQVPSFPGPVIAPPGGPARPGARAGERAAPEEAERPGAYPGPPLRPPAGGGSRSPAHDADESADAPDAGQRPGEIVRWGELLDDRIAAMVSCTFATAGDFLDWLQDRDGLSSLFVSVSGLTRGALMLDGQPIHPDVAEALRDGAASWAMGVTETVRTHIPQSLQDEQNRQTQPGDATAVPWPAESNTAPGLTAAAFDAITGLGHEPTNALEVWQWLQEDLPGLYDALAQMMNGLSQTLARYPVGRAVLTAFANASGSLTEIADYIRGDVLPIFLERHHTELENITNPGPNQQLWDIGKNA